MYLEVYRLNHLQQQTWSDEFVEESLKIKLANLPLVASKF